MRLKENLIGPWKEGLENDDSFGRSRESLRKAENVLYTKDGYLESAKQPEEAIDQVSFRFEDGYILSNTLFYKGYSTSIDSEPYKVFSTDGVTLLSTKSEYFLLTDYGVMKLPQSRPDIVVSPAAGILDGNFKVVLVRDGLASVPMDIVTGGASIAGDPGDLVYLTKKDGSIFYHIGSVPASGVYHITKVVHGNPLDPRILDSYPPAPNADKICLVSGRACYSIGTMLYYSEPFSYGAINVFNSISFPEQITMLGATADQLFVGTANGVYNISSLGNGEQRIQRKSSLRVFDSNSLLLDSAEALSLETSGLVCVWPTESGIQVGGSDGSVFTPKADKLKLTGPSRGVLSFHNKTLFYFSRSN